MPSETPTIRLWHDSHVVSQFTPSQSQALPQVLLDLDNNKDSYIDIALPGSHDGMSMPLDGNWKDLSKPIQSIMYSLWSLETGTNQTDNIAEPASNDQTLSSLWAGSAQSSPLDFRVTVIQSNAALLPVFPPLADTSGRRERMNHAWGELRDIYPSQVLIHGGCEWFRDSDGNYSSHLPFAIPPTAGHFDAPASEAEATLRRKANDYHDQALFGDGLISEANCPLTLLKRGVFFRYEGVDGGASKGFVISLVQIGKDKQSKPVYALFINAHLDSKELGDVNQSRKASAAQLQQLMEAWHSLRIRQPELKNWATVLTLDPNLAMHPESAEPVVRDMIRDGIRVVTPTGLSQEPEDFYTDEMIAVIPGDQWTFEVQSLQRGHDLLPHQGEAPVSDHPVVIAGLNLKPISKPSDRHAKSVAGKPTQAGNTLPF